MPDLADQLSPPASPARDWPEALLAVRRYLRFLGCDWSLAEDLAQDAVLAALRTGHAALPWLLTTARNGYRMHLRQRGRRREVDDLDALHAQWLEVAGDDGAEARRLALQACLRQLPERSRRALELRYGDQGRRAAIAGELGLRPEGLKSLLTRVRLALAACITRRMNDD